MGTTATLALGLYQDILRCHGYACMLSHEDEIETLCMGAIRAVKANAVVAAYVSAAECVRRLRERGADAAVVLGCTELPLALRGELSILLTDSIDALALAAIGHYRSA